METKGQFAAFLQPSCPSGAATRSMLIMRT
jgi:hypothetical protein